MTAGAHPSEAASGEATFADRLPLLAMLTADALAIVGRAIAVCVLVALLLGGNRDSELAAVTATVAAAVAIAVRRPLAVATARAGLWRSSVLADGLAAVGMFAVMLRPDAHAEHPLVLVLGVAATGLGIAVAVVTGARTGVVLAPAARPAQRRLTERWPPIRRRLGALAVTSTAAAMLLTDVDVGWVAFACFAQAAEAVVVLVPYQKAARAPA